MSVKIAIPAHLQPFTGNTEVIEVSGTTVGECLSNLVKKFPGTAEMLFDANGRLLGYIGVYINGEMAHPEELVKPVKDGDEIYLPYIITGG